MKKINTPLVSFIMPVYNGSKYLLKAIDSVIAQSFDDFELILINDGSTDDSLEIMKSYSDNRVKIIDQENQGVARSLNNALSLAKGKYIRRHDADDISTEENLIKQINFLEAHPEYSLVSSQIAYMTDRGKKALKYRNPQAAFYGNDTFVDVDYVTYAKYRPVIHATVLMNRKVLTNLGGYRTEFLTSEDVDLWLRFLDNHKIAVLNDCSYFVRLHNSSATKQHAVSVDYYRDLAFKFAEQRRTTGKDQLQNGAFIEPPIYENVPQENHSNKTGQIYREDLIFYYGILINSKDWVNMAKIIRVILKDGWKDIRNWKLLTFPILGRQMIEKGMLVKKWIKTLPPVS